jgi:peptide-methionine (R)-S-oxide reductase
LEDLPGEAQAVLGGCNFRRDSGVHIAADLVLERGTAVLLENTESAESAQPEGSGLVQRFGRRAFILSAAGAVSAAAFWGLRRSTIAAARPLTADEGPKTVTVVEFSADGKKTGTVTVARLIKSDAEWKKQLSDTSYWVTRHEDTERAFTGDTWNLHDRGLYRCICCDLALFSSDTKFESGTGWPSFWQPIAEENIVKTVDGSEMMVRTAVSCRLCDAHLGHVFDDGPPPTGLRYCMNSASMRFVRLG